MRPLAGLFASALLFAPSLAVAATDGRPAATSSSSSVKRVTVTTRALRHVVVASARVAPMQYAALVAPTDGTLREALVDIGSVVKKGQTLATIDAAKGGKPVTVVAPFAGVVIASGATAGVFVPVGSALFTLIDDKRVRLELGVREVDHAAIKAGMPVTARFDALPSAEFAARLELVVPWIDPRTRTLHADAAIDNPDGRLVSGMSGQATLLVATRPSALAVPLAAIRRDDAGSYVLRLEQGHARRARVELGIVDGEVAEAVSGLAAGDVLLLGEAKEGDAIAP